MILRARRSLDALVPTLALATFAAPALALHTPAASETPREASVAKALDAAQEARRLSSNGRFASRRVDRAEMDRVVRAQVAREVPASVLANEEAQEKLLSVIDPDENYLELVLGMLGSQVAGLYVPQEKALYVVDDAAATGGANSERTVLVHEIVHALQDEHFSLGDRVAWRPEGSDETAAMHALGEGDATLAMLLDTSRGEAIPGSFVDGFTTLMRESNRKMVGERVPTAVADALVDPYVEGLHFVWSLYVMSSSAVAYSVPTMSSIAFRKHLPLATKWSTP